MKRCLRSTAGRRGADGLFVACLLVVACVGPSEGGDPPATGAPGVLRQEVVGQWEPAASLPFKRADHAAVLLQDGKALVVGGYDYSSGQNPLPGLLFDPQQNSWTQTGNLSVQRANVTATRLLDGRVLVAGGDDGGGGVTSAEIYDPASKTFSPAGNMTDGRCDHAAALLPDGRVLVSGGRKAYISYRTSAEVYDPSTNGWASAGSMSTPRYVHQLTPLPTGEVLASGGGSYSSYGSWTNSAELYNPTSNTWRTAGTFTVGRGNHTATLLPSGNVLLAGGRTLIGGSGASTNTSAIYKTANGTWSDGPVMHSAREVGAAARLLDGRVLVTGGHNNSSSAPVAVSELFDEAAPTSWTTTGNLIQGRNALTLTTLHAGKVLAAGGGANSIALSNAELYDSGDGPACRVCQGDGTCVDLVAGTPCGPCGACDGSGTCVPAAGSPCGLCRLCDAAGGCTVAAADDPACGTIDCDGLDTICRDYHDLTGNRCGALGVCKIPNASGTCDAYSDAPLGTQCLAPFCDGTVLHRAHQCGTGAASGQCSEGGTQDCAPYACSAGACRTSCATAADCSPTAFCQGGVCRARGATGVLCSDGAECQSGFCVDGVCCNTTCNGACVACGILGSVGTCTAIPAGTDPDAECSGAGVCGGTCDGTGACTAAAPGDPCGTCRVCSAGNECVPVTDGTSCEGVFFCATGETCQSGACAGGAPLDCDDQNPCTADACSERSKTCLHTPVADGTLCGGTSPCGAVCNAGVCGAGVRCDDNDPCTQDSCAEGVCVHDPIAGCGEDGGAVDAGPARDAATDDGSGSGISRRGCDCTVGASPPPARRGWALLLGVALVARRLRCRPRRPAGTGGTDSA
jgi:hypothetical protein